MRTAAAAFVLVAILASSSNAEGDGSGGSFTWVVDRKLASGVLTAVDADAGGVWAVGRSGEAGLVVHLQPGQWTATTIVSVRELTDVASDRGRVWALERSRFSDSRVFSWDGAGWKRVRLPALPRGSELSALDARGGDVWVVGSYDASVGDRDEMGYLALLAAGPGHVLWAVGRGFIAHGRTR